MGKNIENMFLFLVYLQVFHVMDATYVEDQSRLSKFLFENYDQKMGPIRLQGADRCANCTEEELYLPLNITLSSVQVFDVEDAQQTVSLLLGYLLTWQDHRLKWNSSKFGEIDTVRIAKNSVWIPSVILYPVKEIDILSEEYQDFVEVEKTGRVELLRLTNVKSYCSFQLGDFPFDRQKCPIYFYVWLPRSRANLSSTVSWEIVARLSSYVQGNSEWSLGNITARPSTSIDGDTAVIFDYEMKRRPLFYVYMIMIPAVIINALSLIGLFRRETNKGERLGIGLTNIMTMSFILNILSGVIPKADVLPLLAIYLMVCLGIIIVSLLIVVSVKDYRIYPLKSNEKKEKKKINRMIPPIFLFDVLLILSELCNLLSFFIVIAKN